MQRVEGMPYEIVSDSFGCMRRTAGMKGEVDNLQKGLRPPVK